MLKYPGIVHEEENGYWIEFPDLKGCVTEGDTMEELLKMSKEALSLYLEEYVSNEEVLPEPSKIEGENIKYIEVAPEVGIPLLIKKIRIEQNLTQKEIAEKLHIKYQTYQQIENITKFNATIKTLEKVANALGKNLVIDFQ